MADALLSDDDMGITSGPATPPAPMGSSTPFASGSDGTAPPLTIRPTTPVPPPAPALLSDADMGIGNAASGGQDDGGPTWASTAASPFVGLNSAVKSALSAPGDLLGYGLSKLTGNDAYQSAGSRAASAEMGAVGVDPATHPSRSAVESVLQAAGNAAGSMILPEAGVYGLGRAGLAAAAPRTFEALQGAVGTGSAPSFGVNAAAGAASGAAGQAVGDATGNPLLGMAASMALPLGVAGAVGAYGRLAPAFSRSAAMDAAAKKLYSSFDTPAGTQAAILADDGSTILPGSNPTSFQKFGDIGLGDAERAYQTNDQAAFTSNQYGTGSAQQNEAQAGVLTGLNGTGDPLAVADAFRAQKQKIEDFHDQLASAAAGRAQSTADDVGGQQGDGGAAIKAQLDPQYNANLTAARQATNAVGGTGLPSDQGAALRSSLETARDPVQQNVSALYGALPKDFVTSIAPVQDASREIYGSMGPAKKATVSSVEDDILGVLKQYGGNSVPLGEAMDLDTLITSGMRQMKSGPTPNLPAYQRLVQLKGAWEDALHGGIQDRVNSDNAAVAAGTMAPEDTLASGVADAWRYRSDAAGGQPGALAARAGAGHGTFPAMGGPGSAGQDGAASAPSSRASYAAGDPGVSQAPLFDDTAVTQRPARPTVPRPQDLEGFIRANGGIQDQGGDLASMGMDHLVAKPGKGRSPDAMREAAAEAGYLGADTDHAIANTGVNDLYDRLGAANPVHSVFDQHAVDAWNAYDDQRAQYDRVNGPGSRSAAPPRAPLSAYRQEDAYPLGLAPADLAPKGPAVDAAGTAAVREAKDAHIDLVNRFRKGAVGRALQSDGTAGSYKMSDGSLPDLFIAKGPAGYHAAQAYRAAVGDQPEAIAAFHNAFASKLQRAAVNDQGVIDPVRYGRFMNDYGPALAAASETRTRFDAAAQAGRSLDRFGDYTSAIEPYNASKMYFPQGPEGAAGVRQLRSLIGDDQANAILSDHAASLLKGGKDGPITQDQLDKFNSRYGSAISEFPQLAKKMATAADAEEMIGNAAAIRKESLDTFNKGAARRFLGLTDGSEVEDAIGGLLKRNKVTALRSIVDGVKDDPAAMAGVKQAAAEWINLHMLSPTTEGGASGVKQVQQGAFQDLMNSSHAALGVVLDGEQMKSLRMLSESLRQTNRSTSGVRQKGSPNSAADLLRAVRHSPDGEGQNWIRRIAEGAIAGRELGGDEWGSVIGAGLGIGKGVKDALAAAGMRKTSDVMKQAILDPSFMKVLMQRASVAPGHGSEVSLVKSLRRYSMYKAAAGPSAEPDDQPAPGYKRGGGIAGTMAQRVDLGAADRAAGDLVTTAARIKTQLGMQSAMAAAMASGPH